MGERRRHPGKGEGEGKREGQGKRGIEERKTYHESQDFMTLRGKA